MVRDFLKLNSTEKRILAILASGFVFVVLLYGYFIDQAVMNIAERKQIEKEAAMLNTELGQMEHKYAKLQSKITDEMAQKYGFVDVQEPTFIVKRDNGTFLTLNNEF